MAETNYRGVHQNTKSKSAFYVPDWSEVRIPLALTISGMVEVPRLFGKISFVSASSLLAL
jgi:hypothetical protein